VTGQPLTTPAPDIIVPMHFRIHGEISDIETFNPWHATRFVRQHRLDSRVIG